MSHRTDDEDDEDDEDDANEYDDDEDIEVPDPEDLEDDDHNNLTFRPMSHISPHVSSRDRRRGQRGRSERRRRESYYPPIFAPAALPVLEILSGAPNLHPHDSRISHS
jgi:hypothetical protein